MELFLYFWKRILKKNIFFYKNFMKNFSSISLWLGYTNQKKNNLILNMIWNSLESKAKLYKVCFKMTCGRRWNNYNTKLVFWVTPLTQIQYRDRNKHHLTREPGTETYLQSKFATDTQKKGKGRFFWSNEYIKIAYWSERSCRFCQNTLVRCNFWSCYHR